MGMKSFILKNSFSFVLLGLILLFSFISIYKYSINESTKYVEVEVKQGDSLWKIAKKYNSAQSETAKFVSNIEKANNIDKDILEAGDVLLIPVKEERGTQFTFNK